MTKSQLTAAVSICTAACLLTTWAYSQSPKPLKNPASTFSPPSGLTSQSADPNALPVPAEQKAAKPSRIMFEANWKNVQVSSKPVCFQQGFQAFIWTVKNTGNAPVELGDDYGFSIEPGEEDFIVGNRVMLSVAGEKTTTVEVKASRVMTQSELTAGPQVTVPSQSYGPGNVPTYPSNPTYSPGTGGPSAQRSNEPTLATPAATFAPVEPKGRQKPDTSGGREL